jgi:lipoprotein-anchoring transpeptidase ErfK/SrfK
MPTAPSDVFVRRAFAAQRCATTHSDHPAPDPHWTFRQGKAGRVEAIHAAFADGFRGPGLTGSFGCLDRNNAEAQRAPRQDGKN